MAIETSATLAVGQRALQFEGVYMRNPTIRTTISIPDASFVFIKGSEEPLNLVLLLNWFEELKERMAR